MNNKTYNIFRSACRCLLYLLLFTVATASYGQAFTDETIDAGALPVKLSFFNGEQKSNTIQLNWATATEAGSRHFNVQRSVNQSGFITIGQVNSAGNTTINTSYMFTDHTLPQGLLGYRLEQVDADGKSVFSAVLQFNNRSGNAMMNVYPNPVTTKKITVAVNNLAAGNYTIRVTGVDGKAVLAKTYTASVLTSLQQEIELPAGVAKGMYTISVAGTGIQQLLQQRFIVQ
jgi:hypothetical protein